MDNNTSKLLHTLANPVAFDILMILHEGEKNVLEVRQRLLDCGCEITQPGVSHHLSLFLQTGVVSVRRVGKYRYYQTAFGKYEPLIQALIEYVVTNTHRTAVAAEPEKARSLDGQEIVS